MKGEKDSPLPTPFSDFQCFKKPWGLGGVFHFFGHLTAPVSSQFSQLNSHGKTPLRKDHWTFESFLQILRVWMAHSTCHQDGISSCPAMFSFPHPILSIISSENWIKANHNGETKHRCLAKSVNTLLTWFWCAADVGEKQKGTWPH